MMKVYISGQITGDPFFKEKFLSAERYLKFCGFKVCNPVKKAKKPNQSWSWYMRRDIKLLMDCDAIYLLPDWNVSKGATLEFHIANSVGLKVIEGKAEDLSRYGFNRNS